jgi:hypothetical protein
MIRAVYLREYPVMLHPNNENRDKAANESQVSGPQGQKQMPQTAARSSPLTGRNLYRKRPRALHRGEL